MNWQFNDDMLLYFYIQLNNSHLFRSFKSLANSKLMQGQFP